MITFHYISYPSYYKILHQNEYRKIITLQRSYQDVTYHNVLMLSLSGPFKFFTNLSGIEIQIDKVATHTMK